MFRTKKRKVMDRFEVTDEGNRKIGVRDPVLKRYLVLTDHSGEYLPSERIKLAKKELYDTMKAMNIL